MQTGRTKHLIPALIAAVVAASAATRALPQSQSDAPASLTAEETKFFESKIRPLLIANCYGCHSTSGGKSRGGLKVDTREALLKGGESGPAIVPGDLDSSLLIRAVRYHDADYEMPPAGKLSDADIATLEKWVAMGAPDPRSESAPGDPAARADSPGTAHRWTDAEIASARENHWSYQPVENPALPPLTADGWARTPIDALLFAAMTEHGLTPAADADRRTLLRRASLDLTGLPPTDAELDAFERDRSPEAFARAIDAMLASPRFGERWGRHWLDVARYAESSGKESNLYYPHAWRYRDYVIASFNEDKRFDRFLVEQLAGDLLPATNPTERAENLIATGYLAIGTKSHNARGARQFEMDLVDEQIDAVTQGMLGLTVACARCHDHKFDPIPQKDYYAVAGIFLSTETRYGTYGGQANNHPAALVELPKDADVAAGAPMPAAQRSVIARAHERVKEEAAKSAEIMAAAREARRAGGEVPANLQQQLVRARVTNGAEANLRALASRYDDDGRPTEANLVAMGVAEERRPTNARILDRGELDKPGATVPRGFVRLVAHEETPSIPRDASGRLELAEWIASDRNPLTARVWANRVWQHLFGQPLVPTPDNFGMSGQQPSHPELLDHLASRLMASGWSTKALIREIMLTRAYAMSSAFDAADAAKDPDNTYLWRMPKKRLEAEAIRDSMLAAAGVLVSKPKIGSPINFAEGGARGPAQERILGLVTGVGDNNRSVYLPILRDRVPESLEVFDFAEPSFVTGRRDATNVPTQALYLMNSAELVRIADSFAMRVMGAGDKEPERINAAFMIAFGRKPSSSEMTACRSFIDDFKAAAAKDGQNINAGAGRQPAASGARGQQRGESERLNLRERARQRLEAARNPSNTPAARPVTGEQMIWSALCQALFLSGEFRTLD